MSHIFGFEHSIGGIAGQIFGGIGGAATGFGSGFATASSGGFIGPEVAPGFNAPIDAPAALAAAQGDCATGRKALGVLYRNADGTVCIKPHKRRKRKRRLASASDIKDLSALKTVLSSAQVNTWLATRGR